METTISTLLLFLSCSARFADVVSCFDFIFIQKWLICCCCFFLLAGDGDSCEGDVHSLLHCYVCIVLRPS